MFLNILPGSGQDWKYFIQVKSDHIFIYYYFWWVGRLPLLVVGFLIGELGILWGVYFYRKRGSSGAAGIFRWIYFLPGWVSVGWTCWSRCWNWHVLSFRFPQVDFHWWVSNSLIFLSLVGYILQQYEPFRPLNTGWTHAEHRLEIWGFGGHSVRFMSVEPAHLCSVLCIYRMEMSRSYVMRKVITSEYPRVMHGAASSEMIKVEYFLFLNRALKHLYVTTL